MKIRDRIKELRRVKASSLKPSPRNWRRHPDSQRTALSAVLEEVGYADALLARELPDGTLEIVDGHLRADLDPEQEVPVLVLDVDEAEADILLATVDPLAEMAEADPAKVESLLAEVSTESAAIQAILDGLMEESGIVGESGEEVKLKQLDTKPPPKMTWALIGIPTVRFGEIAEIVETIADLPETIVETTANDG